jgi:hypothetical protein
MSRLFAKGPKTISELTPFSSQFLNILYVAVKLKHVNSKTVLGPFANNLLNIPIELSIRAFKAPQNIR